MVQINEKEFFQPTFPEIFIEIFYLCFKSTSYVYLESDIMHYFSAFSHFG